MTDIMLLNCKKIIIIIVRHIYQKILLKVPTIILEKYIKCINIYLSDNQKNLCD